ncbi:recombinase family protein [Gluconacetobacter sp.]|uniref:recombinase family protein n=1 Tax=Gluconacetobacter sp. TaxID=1935994 RepID=UPI0039EA4657
MAGKTVGSGKIGYARVSTDAQNLDLQIKALTDYGVNPKAIFTDKMTGGTQKRPGLALALKAANSKDIEFVVWKIDRLGRSVLGVAETLKLLRDQGVTIKSLTEPIDTSTPMGQFVLNMLISLAQMERDLIRERTIAGVAAAKARGGRHGRPQVMTEARKMLAAEMLADGRRGVEIWDAVKALPGPTVGRSAYYNFQKDWLLSQDPVDPTDEK